MAISRDTSGLSEPTTLSRRVELESFVGSRNTERIGTLSFGVRAYSGGPNATFTLKPRSSDAATFYDGANGEHAAYMPWMIEDPGRRSRTFARWREPPCCDSSLLFVAQRLDGMHLRGA